MGNIVHQVLTAMKTNLFVNVQGHDEGTDCW